MDVTPAGFASASVTRALLLATAGSSLLIQNQYFRNYHTAAVVLEPFIFRHLGELAIGTYILYGFRILERQRGSESFGAQALVVLASQRLVHWILVASTDWTLNSGPYALLASSFTSFFSDIPALQQYKVLGLTVSDKAVMYTAGAQLLISASRHSLPSIVVGVLVGIAFQSNFLGLKRLKVPSAVSKLVQSTVGAVIGGCRGNQRIIIGSVSGVRREAARHQTAVPVTPEALEQLLSMGFDEQSARDALQQSSNDVQAALARLL